MDIINTAEIVQSSATQQVSGRTTWYNNNPQQVCQACSASRTLEFCDTCSLQLFDAQGAIKVRKFASHTDIKTGSSNTLTYTLFATNVDNGTKPISTIDTIPTGFVLTDV